MKYLLFLLLPTVSFAQSFELVRPADFRYFVTVDSDTATERTLDYKAFQDAVYHKCENPESTVTVHPIGVEVYGCPQPTVYIPYAVYESMIEVVNWQHSQSVPDEHILDIEYTGTFDDSWIEINGSLFTPPDTIFYSEKVYIDVYAVKDNRTVIVRDSVDLETLNELFLQEMATYWTDFSEYTTNQQPSDWTKRWQTAMDFLVQEDAGATGGKVLQALSVGSDQTSLVYALTWDAVDADANRDDVEILMRIRFLDLGASNQMFFPLVRAANADHANREGFVGNMQEGLNRTILEKWVNGTYGGVSSTRSVTINKDTWYWARFRVNGDSLQLKDMFLAEVDEPETWGQSETDSTIPDAGWVGLGTYQRNTDIEIDVFSVATDGGTAPFEDPGGGVTLEAQAGSYSITGKTADLLHDRILESQTGSYSISGKNADLLQGYKIQSQTGSYSIGGKSADLLASRLLSAETGSYAIDGKDASVLVGYVLPSETGNYLIDGKTADLIVTEVGSFTLSAEKGNYAINGKQASLIKDYILELQKGSYSVSGKDASLLKGFNLSAEKGDYVLTGKQVNLLKDYILSLAKGSYQIDGKQADFTIISVGDATQWSVSANELYSISLSEEALYAISLSEKELYIIDTSANEILD